MSGLSLSFSVLSSGSRANCIYVTSGSTRILVDCGLSARETAKRLASIGVDPDSIEAIVVTHEHDDHVCGVKVFANRHKTRVYAAQCLTHIPAFSGIDPEAISNFKSGGSFGIGDLLIEPFSVMHDAADPVGFRISAGSTVLGLTTDLGQVTTLVRERTRDVDALILESNHDYDMLQDAPYPWSLKQRIRSRNGHLSNEAAGRLIEELSSEESCRAQVMVAAHISEKSNLPELALDAFRSSWRKASTPEFFAASAFHPSPLFSL